MREFGSYGKKFDFVKWWYVVEEENGVRLYKRWWGGVSEKSEGLN